MRYRIGRWLCRIGIHTRPLPFAYPFGLGDGDSGGCCDRCGLGPL